MFKYNDYMYHREMSFQLYYMDSFHSYTHKFNFFYLILNYSKIKLRKQTFLIKKNQKFTYLYQQYPAKANPAIPATLQPMTITRDENM